jgi:hypothetical protein
VRSALFSSGVSMLGPVYDEFSSELVNAFLLALSPALPILIVGFARQTLLALWIRPVFSLRKFEAAELSRAANLHDKVSCRLKRQQDKGTLDAGYWGVLTNHRTGIHSDEILELEAHAQYLRATILRLKRRPLQRLETWLRIRSSQFALGRALVAYVVIVALMIALFYVFEQSAWAGDYMSGVSGVFIWYPIDERFLYANAVAAGLSGLALPMLYLMRWLSLSRQYSLESCVFKNLAKTEPAQLIDQFGAEETIEDQPRLAEQSATFDDRTWFAVLGLSESASIEEIRNAYKALIKQNHPDRVHDMSPAFRRLAESETKMINAAYRQALHLFALRV